MDKALHGSDIVDLKTFLEREGVDKHQWKIAPRCPECGDAVHPFNVKAALASFQEAKPEIVARGRHKPGFDHSDNPFDDCPNSFRHDPRFAGLRDIEVDARTRERNKQILLRPDVRLMNRVILTAVMRELTGKRVIPDEDRKKVWRVGEKWLLGMSALAEYPWLMPYALALLQHKHEHKSGHGPVAYRAVGRQILPYTRFDGEAGLAQVPQAIQLNWVNKQHRRISYKPYLKNKTDKVEFELSEEAAHRLAGFPPAPPFSFANIANG